jgi:hypothetical protein
MTETVLRFVPIAKRDPAQKITVGVVYAPNVPDTQGDRASAAVIAKAAHGFNASGKADHIDREHDLKKTGAVAVESYVAKKGDPDKFPEGAWIMAIKHTDSTWADVEAGKINGYSFFGKGQRIAAKAESGVFDLVDLNIEAVSLVNKPANKTQVDPATFIRKSDDSETVALLKQLIAKVDAQDKQIERLKAGGLGKSGGSTAIDVRKAELTAHATRNELKLADLRSQHIAKTAALEAIWEGQRLPGESGVQSEQRLCRELHQLEVEMAAFGKSAAVDLTDPRRSAFTFRGGESKVYRAVPSDSGLELKPSKLTKGEEEIDLSSLRV